MRSASMVSLRRLVRSGGGHGSEAGRLASGHVAGIILRCGGGLGAGAGWVFRLGHGSLQGGVEDLGFGEVLEGQGQSANAGNGDRGASEKTAEQRSICD